MTINARSLVLPLLAAVAALPAASRVLAQNDDIPPAGAGQDQGFWSRPNLTGNWGGARDVVADHGLTVALTLTYVFQGVASGGFNGAAFDTLSDEDDTGHTVSGDLALEFDTEKAGLWRGGFLNAQLEGRAGRSVLQRAGTASAVNNDALFPNVVDRFDEETGALTELTFTQYLDDWVAVFGGLLNTAEGDANELAGSALSNSHFLNSALLYSLVEDATVPNVTLGGGVLFEPNEAASGSFSIFNTEEAAGEDPFTHTQGTTFAVEGTLAHELWECAGAQTFGFLYGIDASRADIAADPRLVLGGILSGQGAPTTNDDTWALYYNAHQYLQGDSAGGWGLFLRFGVSDGNPNPMKWNFAGGLAGRGLLPQRNQDSWGAGIFYLDLSDEGRLRAVDVGDEVGGEVFYNVAVTPWLHATVDLQGVDSAVKRADTALVLALRTHVDF